MNSSTDQSQQPSEYQANMEILRQIPLFSVLPIEALKVLAYFCSRESFEPGEIVFQQEESDANAFYILAGSAQLIHRRDGKEEVLKRYSEGDFLGGLSLLCGMKRLFSLKAEERLECVVLSREKFQKLWEQYPEISKRLIEGLSASIYLWEQRLLASESKCPNCLESSGVTLV